MSELLIEDYYLYCEECKEYFDYWKYDSIKDTSHENHKLRSATIKEFVTFLFEEEECECLNEDFLSSVQTNRQENLRFIKSALEEVMKK